MYESMFTLNIGKIKVAKTNNYIYRGFLKTSKKLESKFNIVLKIDSYRGYLNEKL